MIELDKAEVKRLLDEVYAVMIAKQYGEVGAERLQDLAVGLDRILSRIAYEKLTGGLTVLSALEQGSELLEGEELLRLSPDELPAYIEDVATIQVLSDNELLVAPRATDPLDFAADAVVYHFDGADHFAIDGKLMSVINITPYPSIFGSPTFLLLEESLDAYKLHQALHSQCPVLRGGLWSDERRWFLSNKPEDVLQESLHRYISNTLRGIREVRREQIVGSRPTDIKVTWSLLPRIAYIEIKWMGKSLNPQKTEVTTTFRPSDMNKGARQLAEYLDDHQDEAAAHDTLGYLVVFDARRWRLTLKADELPRENGYYFRAREVTYNPQRDKSRSDFAEPRRFFLEPAETSD